MDLLNAPVGIYQNLHIVWTFLLLVIRYTGMVMFMPGLGGGVRGMRVRIPAIMVFSFVSLAPGNYAVMPETWIAVVAMAASEIMLGSAIGMIPLFIVSGVQTAGGLSSATMGLGASQLVDPTLGVNTNSLSRLLGDISIMIFLMAGGHHIVVYAISGLGGRLQPGSFLINEGVASVFVGLGADVFRIGVMVAAPVIVALLLTQFVMGLVSKAVPSVNIFIVSFPLTIGIGLILTMLALPELLYFLDKEFYRLSELVLMITSAGGAI